MITPLVREHAAEALGRYVRAPEVISALKSATEDEAPTVRSAALIALAQSDDPSTETVLQSALGSALTDSSYAVVATAIAGYAARFPREAFDAYSEAGVFELQSHRSRVEQALIGAGEALGDERMGPYLVDRVGLVNSNTVRDKAAPALVALAKRHEGLRDQARDEFLTLSRRPPDRSPPCSC